MDEHLKELIVQVWTSRLAAEDINSPPASEESLREFEEQFGSIPEEFRWFLIFCGGGPVGAEWVDDIQSLEETHQRFQRERNEGFWPKMNDVFVIGRDGRGNFFGICRSSGKIVTEDHDFGGIHELAISFSRFLIDGLMIDV